MIVLVNAPGAVDDLQLAGSCVVPLAVPGLHWYCSWVSTSDSELPYRNAGFALMPNPDISLIVPFPPSLTPPTIYQIREITVHNPGPTPVQIQINFFMPPNLVTLMNCALPGGHTLSYNASPGKNGGWQRFDNSSFLASSR